MSRRSVVTLEMVVDQLRKRDFAVLSTSDETGTANSAGVTYGVAKRNDDLVIYVMTRRHLRKARDIAHNPQVSLVIPLTRRLLWFLPPPTIQLGGHAELLEWTDTEGTDTFERFWIGRQILKAYRRSYERGERRICFVKITVDPAIHTYMVGSSIWKLRHRMESGAASVTKPPSWPI